MDVTSTATSTATGGATPATANPAPDINPNEGVITSDFETFLRMLTAQLENQDPLNPLDSTDFATQLATFSGVEQQVQTNDLLKGLSDALGATGIGQLANWVGREARAPMPAYFDGTPLTVAPTPAAGAETMALIVRNENGTVLQRTEIPASAEPMIWAGVASDGGPLPPGLYSFTVESKAVGDVISVDTVDVYAVVREARLVDGQVRLIFDGGASADAGAVSALRDPAG